MKLPSRCLFTSIVVLVIPILAMPALSVDGEFDASGVLPAQHPIPVETVAINLDRIVSTQTQFIRHEATEYQRKVAESRARAYMAEHVYKKVGVPAPAPTPKKGSGTVAKTPATRETPAAKTKEVKAAKAKLPRYIAIDTVKDKRSSPETKKVVMIWDTESETLVGNTVYDVTTTPLIGTTAKFETYSAQYVGEGL